MRRRTAPLAWSLSLSIALASSPSVDAAGRGGGGGHVGGGGGGFRGGGGGGFRPAAPAGSGFRPAPAAGGFRPGGFNGGVNPGGFRPGVAGNPAPGVRPGGFNPYPGVNNAITHSPALNVPHNNFNNFNNFNQGARTAINNRPTNVNINNFNRIGNNNLAVNRGNINTVRPWQNGFNPNAGRYSAYRPYYGYHNNWVNGYWHGHYGGWPGGGWGYGGLGYGGYGGLGYGGYGGYGGLGWGLPFLAGLGIGGLGAWGMNPYSYGWGYSNYANPFYGAPASGLALNQPAFAGGVVPTAYDYTMPLDVTASTLPEEAVAPAASALDQAREAFRNGDYPTALNLADQAIKAAPNDADAHEFRGVTLFALGQYKDAATTLYAVLASGPGWDWTTLISLYPDVNVYTQQLRALEQYATQNPNDPSARFVMAYLYTTQGANDAAAREYGALAKLLPSDPLVARLARTIAAPDGSAAVAGAPAGVKNMMKKKK